MDTHDVSELPQFFQRVEDQKRSLQNAQARKGQRPLRQSRLDMITQFMWSMGNTTRGRGPGQTYVATSFVPPPYRPCVKPFRDLTKTAIDDLVLETHHRGMYLLLRCVTPQDRMTAVMAIVEDENGDTILLQLYHQEQAGETSEDILMEGGILLVKEPYLKCTANKGYGLRVDHASDVEFLSPGDKRIPDPWKQASKRKSPALRRSNPLA